MKLKISQQVYQWTENGEHRIGRIVQVALCDLRQLIVQRYHTCELHVVRASELTPYYGDEQQPADRTQRIVDACGPTH